MPVPEYGAAPLAKFFLLVRGFQLLSFIIIVGITANFVSEIVNSGYPTCHEIIGTLTVVSLPPSTPPHLTTPRNLALRSPLEPCRSCADVPKTCLVTFYTLISIAFFYASANLGLLIMAGLDALCLIAFIVIAVVLGKPLSYLQCNLVSDTDAATSAASAFAFTKSIGDNIGKHGDYVGWAGATRANCYESKAVWGLSIALCILFAGSTMVLPVLWLKAKRAGGGAKSAA